MGTFKYLRMAVTMATIVGCGVLVLGWVLLAYVEVMKS
jgi:hypothetical protein